MIRTSDTFVCVVHFLILNVDAIISRLNPNVEFTELFRVELPEFIILFISMNTLKTINVVSISSKHFLFDMFCFIAHLKVPTALHCFAIRERS